MAKDYVSNLFEFSHKEIDFQNELPKALAPLDRRNNESMKNEESQLSDN